MVFTSLFLEDRVEQCLRSFGSEFQTWSPKQRKCESHESCVCVTFLSFFYHDGVTEKRA